MINEGTIFATLAVTDIEAAKDFYGSKLGLRMLSENPGGVMYGSGSGKLFVYQTGLAGTNQATGATWEVSDVEAVVADLLGKGITFEHYNIPGAEQRGDISVMGDMQAAWFKDPSGNVLCISNTH